MPSSVRESGCLGLVGGLALVSGPLRIPANYASQPQGRMVFPVSSVPSVSNHGDRGVGHGEHGWFRYRRRNPSVTRFRRVLIHQRSIRIDYSIARAKSNQSLTSTQRCHIKASNSVSLALATRNSATMRLDGRSSTSIRQRREDRLSSVRLCPFSSR